MDPLAEAQQLFTEALERQRGGELEPASRLYERALALAPGRPSVMNNLAAVYIGLNRADEARRLCERVLQQNPGEAAALLNLGNCLLQEDAAAALAWYEKALQARPDYPEALNSRGNALLELKRSSEALASYDRALAIRPDYAEAHYNRGTALVELGRTEEALASFDRAIAIRPGYADALYNRGNALMKLERLEDALASYDHALAVAPAMAAALSNRGLVLQRLGRLEDLVENHRRLVAIAPDFPYMHGYLLRAELDCCDWAHYAERVAGVTRDVKAGRRADSPFHFLAISESAADQLKCAEIYAADNFRASPEPVWRGERYGHDRIRIAYLSADFHDHALPFLIARLFEIHDRKRFEVTGISLGPEREDKVRVRLTAAFDRLVDVGDRSDREVATFLRELETDIAVDLQGYTLGCRPGIFAHRGAPVQVNYLAYPGTMGTRYIDYIIGDRRVIPEDRFSCYTEKVVWLPDCYQVNDSRRGVPHPAPARAELGLPDDGFVYCCFNNNYKIAPPVFDAWMRILQRVPGSVLWLLTGNEAAARNLRREAERRGVAPERLVFAPRKEVEAYLAQHQAADLFLDTLPYNAHVTASAALWAGLPVLTRLGSTFAGRVAASLLDAVGLPELIVHSGDDYEAMAIQLARDRARLAALKSRLARNRSTHALFDTDRFRAHIEAAYVTMWQRAQRGDPPAGFAVPARR